MTTRVMICGSDAGAKPTKEEKKLAFSDSI